MIDESEVVLRQAIGELGLAVDGGRVKNGSVLDFGSGQRVALWIESVVLARPDWVRNLVARLRPAGVGVVVADQVPAEARRLLDEAGWSWLDRRGHLKLRHGGIFIDADVTPAPRGVGHRTVEPFGGSVALGSALAAMLASPEPLVGVRPTARLLGAAPATVSVAVGRLIEAGLLTRDHRAIVPELFWALADRWKPRMVGLKKRPTPSTGDVVVTGTLAAAALGAPVGHTADYPLELLAVGQPEARRLLRELGETPLDGARIRLGVAPTPLGATEGTGRVRRFPVATPVVVALSLASDPARGSEILEGWEHPHRVW